MLGIKKPGVPHSIISSGMTVGGPCAFTGSLHIDGDVHGDIIASGGEASILTISEHATVNGAVSAGRVVIAGAINGSVQASEVELRAGAHVQGNISYQTLEMQQGAAVIGRLLPQLAHYEQAQSAPAALEPSFEPGA